MQSGDWKSGLLYLRISMPKNTVIFSTIINYLSLSLIYSLQICISFAILYTMHLVLSMWEVIWPHGQQQVPRFTPGKDPAYILKQNLAYWSQEDVLFHIRKTAPHILANCNVWGNIVIVSLGSLITCRLLMICFIKRKSCRDSGNILQVTCEMTRAIKSLLSWFS